MKTNLQQRKVEIISEVHPQFIGSKQELTRMVLQSKIGGADFVKVQLYNSQRLFGNNDRKYLEIDQNELSDLNKYCKEIDIKLTASLFDEEAIDWCEKLDFEVYKIASRTVKENPQLCEKIISTNKKIIISLGMYDYEKNGIPFKNKNISYLYCVSKYPTNLTDIKMPDFNNTFFEGFSDHTIGCDAILYAVSKGATIIEKHFSNYKNINVAEQMAHPCSMNLEELSKIRSGADAITLIQYNEKK